MQKLLLKITISFLAVLILQSCKTYQKIDKESTKAAMLKALQWQEANPIQSQSPTDWTNAAYYTGIVKAHEATADKTYLDALGKMAKRNNWQVSERFYHADDLAMCYSYIYLKSLGQDANLQPTDQIIKDHLYKDYPWKSGMATDEKKILWWWCDALFMAPPVLTSYAKLKNDDAYLKEMDKYYKQTYNLLYDKKEHLFARDTRYLLTGKDSDLKEKNGKKIFWSRGNGWVIAGLALVLTDLPKDYPTRPFYENLFKEMAGKLKGLQPNDGLWRTSLLSPESFNHGEVSGSGFFTYALAWGINNGLLNKATYRPSVTKAWNSLLKCQKVSGKVGWVQNIGSDPKPADADSWQNFGTGAFLMAGSEILKLKKNQ
ncbi:glycoside hydrolase family 88 protein [Pedobacter sp. SD-b]|uniref:Glycoside hydrolase family 88 protein n=1 Tax=Pedobacter segetis TaxID=2793069 RepID=A0ABS1BL23_9SPHI|nr:glycoside hydrolase family 88 protein [Pedobacter segetis]MBK0383595.1 glycoside hydrolase family 88 protein [Pedobacter segetis]